MAIRKLLFVLSISAILLSHGFSSATTSKEIEDLEEEDLSFLEEDDESAATSSKNSFSDLDHGSGDHEPENVDDFEGSDSDHGGYSPPAPPAVDEKDVVVLAKGNFSEFLEKNQYVMVEFYAPWCGHCHALAPVYAAAATELKGKAVLAKVDATVENDLAQKYDVQGFPTVIFFVDGVHRPYPGQRNKDAIVTWIKKKTGPSIHNVTTTEEAETILTSEDKLVLGFLGSLVCPESQELAAVSRLEDDVSFYQTTNPDVAKLFHIDSKAKSPALVMLKKDDEKIVHFDGEFTKSAIVDFVFANKLPLVTTFSRESASLIFENPIKKQLLLFASKSDSDKVLPIFQESAKLFKGKLLFVSVERDNEDVGKPVSEYFGVTGDGPKVLAYEGIDDPKKYILDGELTLDSVKAFGEGFLENKLKPFYKSDPIPDTNDGDIKIVVGDNVDEIVLDDSKDVLLEVYAPWCGHCQALEPIYNKLAKHLRGIESLVIAKMDGTTNEHPRIKADGFPTILFFPAGKKSSGPLPVETDRTVVAFYKFIKKHASIPFKLQKPESAVKSASEKSGSKEEDVKDEL
ncbi:protein disulfide isomerase-like protein 1-4 [Cinnamomum micranthum f. kanehirae]|uniref:protein disulfide-isomerase n=1 Tax=Cinnamomum micranthum f. kanehirae TaxID=337451 RepID=A0A443NZQ4_9MAGN|nr:protein disulfide isomerase-like protein 1-4 [Cinnamomum micranthum f. kanehirae]